MVQEGVKSGAGESGRRRQQQSRGHGWAWPRCGVQVMRSEVLQTESEGGADRVADTVGRVEAVFSEMRKMACGSQGTGETRG